jgi:hypothetical protein
VYVVVAEQLRAQFAGPSKITVRSGEVEVAADRA